MAIQRMSQRVAPPSLMKLPRRASACHNFQAKPGGDALSTDDRGWGGPYEMSARPRPVLLVLFLLLASGCLGPLGPLWRASSLMVADASVQAEPGSAEVVFHVVNATGRTRSFVEYGSSPSYGSIVDATAGPGPKTVLLGFLNENTTYFFRIVAEGPRTRDRFEFAGRFVTGTGPHRWALGEGAEIGPGAPLGDSCTVGFVLRNARNDSLFFVTARHCVGPSGNEVRSADGRILGKVVARGHEGSDWTVVRIEDARRAQVSPAVRYWTGPSGVAPVDARSVNETHDSEIVCYYGWGANYSRVESPRHRCGRSAFYYVVFNEGKATYYLLFDGKADGGDSGAPLIDHATGQAIGIVTARLQPWDPELVSAVALSSILELASRQGWTLGLAASHYAHPPAEPT